MFPLLFLQLISCSLALALAAATSGFNQAKRPDCQSKCGNITIPYPFGIISTGCSINGVGYGYNITCNTTYHPPKPFIGNGNIEIVSISDTEIRIKNTLALTVCYDKSGKTELNESDARMIDLFGTQFTYSDTKNRFYGTGCNTAALIQGSSTSSDQYNYGSGCVSICFSKKDVREESCTGSGCCQITIPKGLRAFTPKILNVFANPSVVWSSNTCRYAFLGEKEQYTFHASDIQKGSNFSSKVRDIPIVLDWGIGNKTCEEAKKDSATYACQENSFCKNLEGNPGYRCTCNDGYDGNPYLSPGCQDVNECENGNNNCHSHGICTNTNGSYTCSCPKGYDGDGRKDGGGCKKEEFPIRVIFGIIGLSLFIFIVAIYWLYLSIRKRKIIKLQEKFFQQNGGSLLLKQISSHEGGVESTKIFTAKELKVATNNYDESRILGRGGYGIVYKGTLSNNHMVAVKKSKIVDQSQIEQFINEVVILTQINHRNVVNLMGCCLESEVPLLVYEYVSNGTLLEHIHSKDRMSTISWESRLRIATETATALSYLHSAASIPIIHRDVKSTNILLDENYTAKVSDFGASRLIPLDQSQLSTLVQGTLGYLDPEYFNTSHLTEKSDVYSFGVVLLELLTGEKPISYERSEEQRKLTTYFISSMEENNIFQILEPRVVNESTPNQLIAVAELAKRCLSLKGEERPTMKQVAAELDGLRTTETHVWVRQPKNEKEKSLPSEPTDLYIAPLISNNVVDSGQCSIDTTVIASMNINILR